MVKKAASQRTQLIVMRPNGTMRDMNRREIAAKDVDRDTDTPATRVYMPHVALATQLHSQGRLCLLNRAYLWFEQD